MIDSDGFKEHLGTVLKVILFIIECLLVLCPIVGGIILLVCNNQVFQDASCIILSESDYESVKDDWFSELDRSQAVNTSVNEKNAEYLFKGETYYCVFSYSGFIGISFSAYSPSGFIDFNDSAVNVLQAEGEVRELKKDAKQYIFRAWSNGEPVDVACNVEGNRVNFGMDTTTVLVRMRVVVAFTPYETGAVDASAQLDFVSEKNTISSGDVTRSADTTYEKSVRITDISTRFIAAKNCENGEIDDNLLFDDAVFNKNETYYAVTDFIMRPMRDNDGSGIVDCAFGIHGGTIECTLFEASSGDFTQISDENGTKITLSVKLPPLVNDNKKLRVIIKFTPKAECEAEYSLSFHGNEITCVTENGEPIVLHCLP